MLNQLQPSALAPHRIALVAIWSRFHLSALNAFAYLARARAPVRDKPKLAQFVTCCVACCRLSAGAGAKRARASQPASDTGKPKRPSSALSRLSAARDRLLPFGVAIRRQHRPYGLLPIVCLQRRRRHAASQPASQPLATGDNQVSPGAAAKAPATTVAQSALVGPLARARCAPRSELARAWRRKR